MAQNMAPRPAVDSASAPQQASGSRAAGLVDIYNQYFYYRIARAAEEVEAAHRLRYQVYCEETGYLCKEDNPDGLEIDEHDSHSIQSVLYYRPLNLAAGTVRVVLPVKDVPYCNQPARMAAPALDQLPDRILPKKSTGEISRFAIHSSFRKRQDDGLYASVYDVRLGNDPRRVLPHMTLGLMTSIFEITLEAKLTHLCAIIDPALLRLLRMLGLRFEAVGPLVEFHGPRQPVFASCKQLIDGVKEGFPEIYNVISGNGRFHLEEPHDAA